MKSLTMVLQVDPMMDNESAAELKEYIKWIFYAGGVEDDTKTEEPDKKPTPPGETVRPTETPADAPKILASSSPRTGDSTMLIFYIFLAVISAVGIVIVLRRKRSTG